MPKHRNELECWNVAQIHRHPNFKAGDEFNIRGIAAEGNRVGGGIRGTRPDIDAAARLDRRAA